MQAGPQWLGARSPQSEKAADPTGLNAMQLAGKKRCLALQGNKIRPSALEPNLARGIIAAKIGGGPSAGLSFPR
jgi:hypothetical protein